MVTAQCKWNSSLSLFLTFSIYFHYGHRFKELLGRLLILNRVQRLQESLRRRKQAKKDQGGKCIWSDSDTLYQLLKELLLINSYYPQNVALDSQYQHHLRFCLKCKFLSPIHSKPAELETLGLGTNILVSNKLSWWFWGVLILKSRPYVYT